MPHNNEEQSLPRAERPVAFLPAVPLLLILGLLAAIGPMSIDMYLPSMPTIAREFAVAPGDVQMTLSVFFVGFAVVQLAYGPLSDRFGRRPVLLGGIAVYVAASALCALSDSIDDMVLFRALQALGGGAGAVIARAIVRDLFTGTRASRVMSHMTLVVALAPLLAPLIGGQILALWGWRTIFGVLAGFGVVCLLAVLFSLPESNPRERRPKRRASSVFTDYLMVLKDRTAVGCLLTSSSIFVGLFAYLSGTPFVFIELHGVSPQSYGYLFGLNVLALMGGAIINSRLVARIGTQPMLTIGAIVAAVSGLLLLTNVIADIGGLAGIVAPLFLYSGTLNLIGANSMVLAAERFGSRAGAVSALFGSMQFGIGALGAAAIAMFNDGSALPMALVVAIGGVGCVAAQLVIPRPPHPA